jgi:hypothetical protein
MCPCPSAGRILAFDNSGYEFPNDRAVISIGSYRDISSTPGLTFDVALGARGTHEPAHFPILRVQPLFYPLPRPVLSPRR